MGIARVPVVSKGRAVYARSTHPTITELFCMPKPRMKRPRKRIVVVNDKMQKRYRYELSAPMGRNFDPEFVPQLTPREMLRLGVFCGKYMTDGRREFPASWFARARLAPHGRDCALNFFGVDASQPLSVWRKKGWLHPDDPRGWFQWYCRYYMGRRMPDEDRRQIKRWKAIRRHVRQIERHCEPGDLMCRKRQRQALLHWAYDSRKI
jgi:hypothetical protein